jgi:hypothetical protein
MANFDLDLDALSVYKTIKLNGKGLKIKDPSINQLVKLFRLSYRLQGAEAVKDKTGKKVMSDDNVLKTADSLLEFRECFNDLCPELKDEGLNERQLMALFELIQEMITSDDLKELKKRGISLAGSKDESKKKLG